MKKLIAIQCKACSTILSMKDHGWRACKCFRNVDGNTGIYLDAGDPIYRVGGKSENIIEIKEA